MSHSFHHTRAVAAIVALGSLASLTAAASGAPFDTAFADQVVSYDPGSATFYTDPSAALGKPNDIVSASIGFPSVLSPFNPAWEEGELVRVGEGGHLTLRLSHYALPTAGLELGVFVNVGLSDASYPNGTATNPATTFSPVEDSVIVEVSDDGVNFVALNGGAATLMTLPTNYYNNAGPADGAAPSEPDEADFGKPFDATLADFNGLSWSQILALLDGSAGGNWLDISASGLSEVGYVRFSVLDDGDALTALDFELLAVSVASGAVGAAVPEPASAALLGGLVGALVMRRRRGAAESHAREGVGFRKV